MTTYPVRITLRDSLGSVRIDVPDQIGVPEVDAQLDLLVAVEAKRALAVRREQEAVANLRDKRNAAALRLRDSMRGTSEPDLSGNVEVEQADMVAEAAKQITRAASEALAVEVRSFHSVMGEHADAVRTALWKKTEKAREALAGAAAAAELAESRLNASAGLLAGLDSYLNGDRMARQFAHASYGGAGVKASLAAQHAKEALSELGVWMNENWKPTSNAVSVEKGGA